MNNKKLSIITINYNNLDGLIRTVESVVNQTWQEFEYIVIDGGSTDGSAEYIETQSDKIDYWVSEPDRGIYNAMNKGILKATGEYLLFLNGGDHFYNDIALSNIQDKIIDYDLIYCNLEVLGDMKDKIVDFPKELKFSFMFANSLPHPATFIKSDLFKKFGLYDENYKIVSDWKFFILMLFKNNCTYMKIDQTLSTFYLGGICSDVTNKNLHHIERQKVLESDFKFYLEDINELFELKSIISSLRKSRKINLLVKLGMINKF